MQVIMFVICLEIVEVKILIFFFLPVSSFSLSLFEFRYLCSLVETILIYQQFHKPCVEQLPPKQELVDFWMDFMVEATKKDVSSVRFPVSDSHQGAFSRLLMHFRLNMGGKVC